MSLAPAEMATPAPLGDQLLKQFIVGRTESTETSEIQYELPAKEILATAQEMQQIEEDEADKETLSQAIGIVLATTRGGRKRIVTVKVVGNAAQAREAKRAKAGGYGGCGGQGSGQAGVVAVMVQAVVVVVPAGKCKLLLSKM
jgi:hypothetical protein